MAQVGRLFGLPLTAQQLRFSQHQGQIRQITLAQAFHILTQMVPGGVEIPNERSEHVVVRCLLIFRHQFLQGDDQSFCLYTGG